MMRISKQSTVPVFLTLTAAALATTGCDSAPDIASAAPGGNTLLDLSLSDPAYYVNLGHEFRTRKKLGEAVAAYRKAIQIDTNDADAYQGLGDILAEQNRTEQAIAAYRRAVQSEPDNAKAYVGLGNILTEQSRIEEAIVAYRSAIQANPKQAVAYEGLGKVLLEQKRLPEAISNFKQALKSEEKSPRTTTTTLVSMGLALQAQGKLDGAIAAFRKAAKADPSYVWTHIYLGHALAADQQFNDAKASYRAVLKQPLTKKAKLGSSYALARNGLGLVLQRQGKLKAAVGEFEQAAGLDASYQSARNNLKRAKQMLALQPPGSTKPKLKAANG